MQAETILNELRYARPLVYILEGDPRIQRQ